MRWKWWQLRSKNRRLDLSTGGCWFLLFTLVLGVVAIYSGNNVIYLLESLLLSALLFSGVLSELTVSRLRVERIVRQAVAGAPAEDLLVLENTGRLPLYCVEVSEWGADEAPLHFVLVLPGRGRLELPTRQVIGERGRHSWKGLTVATSFPFGFARKIRFFSQEGSRIVWPRCRDAAAMHVQTPAAGRGEWEISLGELEEASPGDDLTRIHWPSTLRTSRLQRRPLRRTSADEEVELRLFPKPADLEAKIEEAAFMLRSHSLSLVLVEEAGRRRVLGSSASLDVLALLPKEDAA